MTIDCASVFDSMRRDSVLWAFQTVAPQPFLARRSPPTASQQPVAFLKTDARGPQAFRLEFACASATFAPCTDLGLDIAPRSELFSNTTACSWNPTLEASRPTRLASPPAYLCAAVCQVASHDPACIFPCNCRLGRSTAGPRQYPLHDTTAFRTPYHRDAEIGSRWRRFVRAPPTTSRLSRTTDSFQGTVRLTFSFSVAIWATLIRLRQELLWTSPQARCSAYHTNCAAVCCLPVNRMVWRARRILRVAGPSTATKRLASDLPPWDSTFTKLDAPPR